MTTSAVFLGTLGLLFTFLPQEISVRYGVHAGGVILIVVQIAGALCLGFAILNWMARGVMIGGIYARPVTLGNFLHFFMVSLAGWRTVAGGTRATEIIAVCLIYTVFALWFGIVMMTHPAKRTD